MAVGLGDGSGDGVTLGVGVAVGLGLGVGVAVAVGCVGAVGVAGGVVIGNVVVGDALGSAPGAPMGLNVGVITWEGTATGIVAGRFGRPLRLSALGTGGNLTIRNSPTRRSASGSVQMATPANASGTCMSIRTRFSLSDVMVNSLLCADVVGQMEKGG